MVLLTDFKQKKDRTMKKKHFKFLFVLLVASATFCTQEKLEPGIPVSFDSIQSDEFEPVMEKGLEVGKHVSIEGYLGLQDIMSLQSDTIMVNLFEDSEKKGQKISISFPVGSNENQMEGLPDTYKEDDLKVHTNLKEIVGTKDKVRIHGTRLGYSKESTIYIRSKWIEKVK